MRNCFDAAHFLLLHSNMDRHSLHIYRAVQLILQSCSFLSAVNIVWVFVNIARWLQLQAALQMGQHKHKTT